MFSQLQKKFIYYLCVPMIAPTSMQHTSRRFTWGLGKKCDQRLFQHRTCPILHHPMQLIIICCFVTLDDDDGEAPSNLWTATAVAVVLTVFFDKYFFSFFPLFLAVAGMKAFMGASVDSTAILLVASATSAGIIKFLSAAKPQENLSNPWTKRCDLEMFVTFSSSSNTLQEQLGCPSRDWYIPSHWYDMSQAASIELSVLVDHFFGHFGIFCKQN